MTLNDVQFEEDKGRQGVRYAVWSFTSGDRVIIYRESRQGKPSHDLPMDKYTFAMESTSFPRGGMKAYMTKKQVERHLTYLRSKE